MKYSLNIQAKVLLLGFMLTASMILPRAAMAVPATGPVDLATSPLATSTTSAAKPNLLFVLDDSGSMNWDHMPDDQADGGSSVSFVYGYYGLRSSQCNQVYYDPSLTYLPPVKANGDPYPDASFTGAWVDGFSTGAGTVNLNTSFKASQSLGGDSLGQSAYYYTYSGEQDTQLEKNYHSTTNAFYKECNDSTGSSTSAIAPLNGVNALTGGAPSPVGSGVFTKRRLATTMTTTIVVGGTSGTNVSINDIKVNGIQIMSGASTGSTSTSTVATNVAAKITLSGFSATASGSTITVTGPTSAVNQTPVITESTSMTFTADIFPDTTAANQTNFANWYSYYRTRMLMMKTATGRAFSSVNNKYRVGLMKISSTGTPAVQMGTFEGAQRDTWYDTLYGVSPGGSTPLRRALSEAGRYFAGKLGGTDPVQFSCQQNFNILSTDGYWNTGGGYDVNGAAVGNQDGAAARPMYDGTQSATTVTTTYVRNKYSTSSSGCSGGKKKLKTQPEISSCSVTLGVETCGSWSNNGAATFGSCQSSVTLPTPNPSAKAASGTPVTTAGATGGTSDNLADIAMYYYNTDLRPGTCTLCTDNVFTSNTDKNTAQHMTTFTLGLGASGWMNYSPAYLSDGAPDFEAVELGSTASASVCTWQATGTVCNWPVPGMSGSDGLIANIDDLWHAAVNGRGAYFSATNPETLSYGLANALAAINTRRGAAAAAATSTLNPVAGNNFAYVASYSTVTWKGNLESRQIDTLTGEVNRNAAYCVEDVSPDDCAGTVVSEESGGNATVKYCVTPNSVICTGGVLEGTDCKVPVAVACSGTLKSKVTDSTDTRKIWTKGPNATTLNNFNISGGDLSAADFSATKLAGLTQWPTLDAAQRTDAVNSIVGYLRGQKGKEDTTVHDDVDRLFRYREATLGDAVDSQPAYIGPPTFSYTDAGYSTFKSISRTPVVYMGANDGMMHAFDANSLEELWAYVPSMVIPNMWKLADKNYAVNHQYYANGSPIISDVFDGSSWRTILVAGLNGGGRGYYALDITNPTAPTLLWEFTPADDPNLGYTFGNPVITKKADGKWVVLVTSGYNNIPEPSKTPLINTGDGGGYLYVLDAINGPAAAFSKIPTGEGTASVPSGLAQIAAWADEPEKNNTATFTYGGDLLGNVWRFDINAGTVTKFAKLQAGSGTGAAQPITTKPELGKVLTSDGKAHRVVFIGTGKYLEIGDIGDKSQQTLYAIKDDDTLTSTPTPTLVNPRGSTSAPNRMVEQTLSASATTRTASNHDVDFETDRGWFVDLALDGERQNVAAQLVLGTLIVPTTVPSSTVCEPGGTSWLNYFNYKTGGAVDPTSSNQVSSKANAPIVGINVIYVNDPVTGKPKPKVSVVTSNDPTPELIPGTPFSSSGSGFQKKRAIWRELIKP